MRSGWSMPRETVPMGGSIGRRAMLRALGLGAAGLSLGGLELLAGCTSGGDGDGGGEAGGDTGPDTGPGTTVRPYDPDRPYWEQGNFAAVTTEETFTDLEVTGTIPPELSGLFV